MRGIYKILFILIIFITGFQYSFAQDSLTKVSSVSDVKTFIAIQGTYVRHLGHFSDAWAYTTGVYLNYGFYFPGNYILNLKSGYLSVHNRKGTNFPANSGATIIPIVVGGKYFFDLGRVRPYLSFNNGGNIIFQKVDFEGQSDEKSMFKYYWQAGAGTYIKISDKLKLDVSVNLNSHFYEDANMMTGFEYMIGLEY